MNSLDSRERSTRWTGAAALFPPPDLAGASVRYEPNVMQKMLEVCLDLLGAQWMGVVSSAKQPTILLEVGRRPRAIQKPGWRPRLRWSRRGVPEGASGAEWLNAPGDAERGWVVSGGHGEELVLALWPAESRAAPVDASPAPEPCVSSAHPTYRETVRRLHGAQDTAALLAEQVDGGLLLMGPGGGIRAINRCAATCFGIDQDQAMGMRIDDHPRLSALSLEVHRFVQDGVDHRQFRVNQMTANIRWGSVRRAEMVVTLAAPPSALEAAPNVERRRYRIDDLVGSSANLTEIRRMIPAAARCPNAVLVTGESGTGKEVVAQAIHSESASPHAPFIGINCAAIPETMLELELFGYAGGAFSDAQRGGHAGKLEMAAGGTLLLDEIGDMPLGMQAKLLRVLQERSYYRLGGSTLKRVNTRIVATTNQPLEKRVSQGRFRADLLFRLSGVHLHVTPLRARPEDIGPILEHFVHQVGFRLDRSISVAPEVIRAAQHHDWPGNVRELQHLVEREVILLGASDSVISRVPPYLSVAPASPSGPESAWRRGTRPRSVSNGASPPPVLALQREEIQQALVELRGQVTRVARRLGVSRSTLYRRLREFGINPKSYRTIDSDSIVQAFKD